MKYFILGQIFRSYRRIRRSFNLRVNTMAAFNPVKCVIFDMDGLLLDTEKIYYETFEKIFAKYGKTYTKEASIRVMGTVPKDTYSIFVNDYGLPLSVEDLGKEINRELLVAMESASSMAGAEKLVKHLHENNIPIAVATSSDKDTFVPKTKNHQDMFKLFNHIVLGSVDPEVKKGKPAPDIYLVCASRFPQKPESHEVLVFEDAPNGVVGARAAGMQVVMVPDPIVPEEKRRPATKVLNSLNDFKPEEFGLPAFK